MSKIWRIAGEIIVNLPNVYVLRGKDPYQHVYEEFMELFDGREAYPLADKFVFIETVKKLNKGYKIPRQILVKEKPSENRIKEVSEEINSWGNPSLYLKPVTGANSRGIKILSPGEIPTFLRGIKENYVVQEDIKFEREFRYAISRGFDGLTRRFCYEKVKPRITGNGSMPLGILLITNRHLPLHTKVFSLWSHRRELLKVIPKGEKYTITHVANPPAGSFERNIDEPELVNKFDDYFATLVSDLEKEMGAPKPWPLVCFDFGITSGTDINKETVVPIELQMPFSALIYFSRCRRQWGSLLYFYYTALPIKK